MQGKRNIASDTKCYDVITGKEGIFVFSEHIIYHSKGLSLLIIFLLKDHDLKIPQKTNISHFL